ncbi:fimbrillin family protein [Phocaeicola plebeius]|uniref:fimbrillin family protein n=1 Tax=Phocaeicola plebeius TaxID=310297 RepID=UPI0026EE6BAF|nr:fimbrillin family protein [Phocaeicola plebeius]
MKTIERIFLSSMALLAMTACNNELNEQLASNNGGDVKFTMGIEGTSASRVTMEDGSYQASFADGDKVGIFVKEVTSYANLEYTYSGNAWTGAAVSVPADGVYTYSAYYPYTDGATATAIITEVQADQETSGYLANDFLMSSLTATAGQTNVGLQFTHALSLVEVTLSGPNAAEDAVVTLSNMTTDATMNLEASTVTPGEKKANVTMDKLTTSMKYRAIVPEQTVAQGTALMTIVSKGRTYKVSYKASDVKFERGKYISLNVELGSSSAEDYTVTITSQNITDWGQGTSVDGGATVDEVPLIETIGENLVSFTGTADRNANIGDTWFKLINAAGTTAGATGEIVESGSEEVVWEKAAKLTYTSVWDAAANNNQGKAVNNSYYIATVGYLHDAAIYTSDTEVYKLTFKAKSNLVKTTVVDGTETPVELSDAAKIVVTCRNSVDDASFAMSGSSSIADDATTTTMTVSELVKDTWKECVAYIHFGKKSEAVGSVTSQKPMVDSETSDLQKIDIRFYTNNPSSADGEKITATIFISEVTLEPYIK